jgi:NDP-sugar pyrophosphorylase family protein
VQAVVIAGGLATRMRPRTLTVPKAMLPVAGRPFIEWQLEKLVSCGFTQAILCVAHLAEQIEDHVKDGARFGIEVKYSHEGQKLLGTAGAIRAALPLLAPTFLVTYGDSYLPFDYGAPVRVLQMRGDCDGVMSVYKNEGKWDPSNVETDGEWVLRYEKGKPDEFDHIDYGAIALDRDVIAALPDGQAMGLDLVQKDLAARRRLRAYVASDRFFEIGSPEGLATLDVFLGRSG